MDHDHEHEHDHWICFLCRPGGSDCVSLSAFSLSVTHRVYRYCDCWVNPARHENIKCGWEEKGESCQKCLMYVCNTYMAGAGSKGLVRLKH